MTRNGSSLDAHGRAALARVGGAAPARAQQVSEARIRELIKQAAERVGSRQTTPPARSADRGAAGDTRPIVALTLDDAVKFALERNLDIAVQRLNPEINDIAIASIQSVYHPALTSLISTQSHDQRRRPARSRAARRGRRSRSTPALTTYNGGIAQSIPWGGGASRSR